MQFLLARWTNSELHALFSYTPLITCTDKIPGINQISPSYNQVTAAYSFKVLLFPFWIVVVQPSVTLQSDDDC